MAEQNPNRPDSTGADTDPSPGALAHHPPSAPVASRAARTAPRRASASGLVADDAVLPGDARAGVAIPAEVAKLHPLVQRALARLDPNDLDGHIQTLLIAGQSVPAIARILGALPMLVYRKIRQVPALADAQRQAEDAALALALEPLREKGVPRAVQTILDVMDDEDATHTARLAAAKMALDMTKRADGGTGAAPARITVDFSKQTAQVDVGRAGREEAENDS